MAMNYGELLVAAKLGERSALNDLGGKIKDLAADYRNYRFRAESQIHGFRAGLAARKLAEDRLIAALKAENANHPLASREAIEAIVQENAPKVLHDPEIIKKTYPDGVLPEGAVVPPNLVQSVA
jgi:hypothetical protein